MMIPFKPDYIKPNPVQLLADINYALAVKTPRAEAIWAAYHERIQQIDNLKESVHHWLEVGNYYRSNMEGYDPETDQALEDLSAVEVERRNREIAKYGAVYEDYRAFELDINRLKSERETLLMLNN
jgi:hypothetical protein